MKALIEIGFSRWNAATFSVSCGLCDLSSEKMQELRAMIPVAIGIAEDMWRREQARKNPAASAMPEAHAQTSQAAAKDAAHAEVVDKRGGAAGEPSGERD